MAIKSLTLRVGKTQANVVEKYFGILKGTEKEVRKRIKEIKKARKAVDAEFAAKQKMLRGIYA